MVLKRKPARRCWCYGFSGVVAHGTVYVLYITIWHHWPGISHRYRPEGTTVARSRETLPLFCRKILLIGAYPKYSLDDVPLGRVLGSKSGIFRNHPNALPDHCNTKKCVYVVAVGWSDFLEKKIGDFSMCAKLFLDPNSKILPFKIVYFRAQPRKAPDYVEC